MQVCGEVALGKSDHPTHFAGGKLGLKAQCRELATGLWAQTPGVGLLMVDLKAPKLEVGFQDRHSMDNLIRGRGPESEVVDVREMSDAWGEALHVHVKGEIQLKHGKDAEGVALWHPDRGYAGVTDEAIHEEAALVEAQLTCQLLAQWPADAVEGPFEVSAGAAKILVAIWICIQAWVVSHPGTNPSSSRGRCGAS